MFQNLDVFVSLTHSLILSKYNFQFLAIERYRNIVLVGLEGRWVGSEILPLRVFHVQVT